jgi:hypothetical protein
LEKFLKKVKIVRMAMSSSELTRRIQEAANQYVSRNKVRDSSELTLINQAKASKTAIPQTVPVSIDRRTNQIVPPYQYASDLSCNVVFTGNGTNMDYSAILQKSQSCAVCSDDDPSLNPYIKLPTVCINPLQFPFIQKDLSTPVICTWGGFNKYFPPGPQCYASTNIYVYPSAN